MGRFLADYFNTTDMDRIQQMIDEDYNDDSIDYNPVVKRRKRTPSKPRGQRTHLFQYSQLKRCENPTDLNALEQQVRGSFATAQLIKLDIAERAALAEKQGDAELQGMMKQLLDEMNRRRAVIAKLAQLGLERREDHIDVAHIHEAYKQGDAEILQIYFPHELELHRANQEEALPGEVSLALVLTSQGAGLEQLQLSDKDKATLLSRISKIRQ